MTTETTARDIRLTLASLLDQLDQLQNTEIWDSVVAQTPAIADAYQIASTTLDDLWFVFRCATTNQGE